MTNADKIRNMTDDDLAKFVDHITLACYCCGQDSEAGHGVDERYPHCVFRGCTGRNEISAWLKQESE